MGAAVECLPNINWIQSPGQKHQTNKETQKEIFSKGNAEFCLQQLPHIHKAKHREQRTQGISHDHWLQFQAIHCVR